MINKTPVNLNNMKNSSEIILQKQPNRKVFGEDRDIPGTAIAHDTDLQPLIEKKEGQVQFSQVKMS